MIQHHELQNQQIHPVSLVKPMLVGAGVALLAVLLSLLIYFVGLWFGTVLGLAGIMWD